MSKFSVEFELCEMLKGEAFVFVAHVVVVVVVAMNNKVKILKSSREYLAVIYCICCCCCCCWKSETTFTFSTSLDKSGRPSGRAKDTDTDTVAQILGHRYTQLVWRYRNKYTDRCWASPAVLSTFENKKKLFLEASYVQKKGQRNI